MERDTQFLPEVWALYGLGMAVLILRLGIRLQTVGVRGLQGDDAFALLLMVFYTMDAATVHIVYYTGTNVEASVLQATRPLTDAEIRRFEHGSKEQLIAWYSYTALIWCLKGTMLCFFKRITIGLWQSLLVTWLMYGCAISYVAVLLTITFGCFPTNMNWQVVPDPGAKCTFKLQNFVVTVVLNVVTDAAILCIPLPLLWKLQIPLRKKLVIGLLICSGLFVITAAIIRVVLTIGSNPSALNINRWGVRETIVGIVAVNIPILRPLFRGHFWKTGKLASAASQGHGASGGGCTTIGGGQCAYEMRRSVSHGKRDMPNKFHGSEEFILAKPDQELQPGPRDVVVRTAYQVTSEAISHYSRAEDSWRRDVEPGTMTSAYAG